MRVDMFTRRDGDPRRAGGAGEPREEPDATSVAERRNFSASVKSCTAEMV